MSTEVQNLNNGFERKWTMGDVENELTATVLAMAAGSFNLVGVAVLSLTIGVYVDKLPIKDVKTSLDEAIKQLQYGRTSRYMLTTAAIDVGREFIKAFGHPKAETRNAFWQDIEEAETVSDAVAVVVARMKAHYGIDTMQGLSHKLKGEPVPKAAKTAPAPKADTAPAAPPAAPADADIPQAPSLEAVFAAAESLNDTDLTALLGMLVELQASRADKAMPQAA